MESTAVAPVVVVTRAPDCDDMISLHGVEAQVVYIDLGSSFDGKPDDEEQARSWAESVWSNVKELPEDHPARNEVAGVIASTCEGMLSDAELEEVLS